MPTHGRTMTASEILRGIRGLRVLVIGDLMLDHYVTGSVSRISPEAPVPVVKVGVESCAAGGAANVAANLAGLGVTVSVAGVTGDDDAAHRLLTVLEEAHIETAGVIRRPGVSTIVKTRVIAQGQQVCRIDREDNATGYEFPFGNGSLAFSLQDRIAGMHAVILSDYAKGAITQPLLELAARAAQAAGILIAADPKPSRPLTYSGMTLLTPNRQESLPLAGLNDADAWASHSLENIFAGIHARHRPEHLLITLGADGMALGQNGIPQALIPAEAREVFDISGAGDTVIAVMTAALAAGALPVDAAKLANRAAGLIVGRRGTVPIQQEMLSALHTGS
jgi:rfaE bifunctional protein kinase chain/domain